ncbi:hypothetical protein EYF80_030858 [Liparis tanakae]|uniref:Uncharacterized protein n=1 Tax=Liparis tanakae TaxID=230148 RepID=A0A4Z2H0S0_9TELE|nr:hypothetical protein EYF80_030858 [Liparis tanakae]
MQQHRSHVLHLNRDVYGINSPLIRNIKGRPVELGEEARRRSLRARVTPPRASVPESEASAQSTRSLKDHDAALTWRTQFVHLNAIGVSREVSARCGSAGASGSDFHGSFFNGPETRGSNSRGRKDSLRSLGVKLKQRGRGYLRQRSTLFDQCFYFYTLKIPSIKSSEIASPVEPQSTWFMEN